MAQQQPLSSAVPPTDVYGGDEISALVLDPGYSYTRAGFAGEEVPKQILSSYYARVEGHELFGEDAIFPRAGLEVCNYMSRDSTVEDWDVATKMWEHMLVKRLQPPRPTPPSRNGLNDNPKKDGDGDVEMMQEEEEPDNSGAAAAEMAAWQGKPLAENPLLMTEAPWNATKAREKTIETIMENWGCPAFWMSRTSVLAAFAAGKATALVVDVGGANTSVAAVHDGLLLKRSVQRSPVGGVWLNEQIRSMWAGGEPRLELTPYFMIENKKAVEAGAPAEARLKKFAFNVNPSLRAFGEEQTFKEFKESVVEVWRGPGRYMAPGVEDFARSQPGRVFQMPDGYNQMWREQRFKVAEGMWDETAAYPVLGGEVARVTKVQTIPELIRASLSGVDIDLRPALLGNVVVTGSSSLLNGFNDRLNNELAHMYPGLKVKVHAAGLSQERRFGSWLGGSILASLGTFHQLWISRAEYDENGSGIVEKRCK